MRKVVLGYYGAACYRAYKERADWLWAECPRLARLIADGDCNPAPYLDAGLGYQLTVARAEATKRLVARHGGRAVQRHHGLLRRILDLQQHRVRQRAIRDAAPLPF